MRINRGAALMVGASLGFTLMVACVKQCRAEMSAVEIVVWRAALSIPIVWWLGRGDGFHLERRGLFLVRAALGFCAMLCGFSAARGLSLGDLTFIWRLQPVFVALLAPLALGVRERVGWQILAVLGAGLIGCAILLGPDLGTEVGVYGLLALGGAALSGAAHVCIRALSATEPASAIVFWFQVFAAIGAMAICWGTIGTPLPIPPENLLPYLVGTGIFASIGQTLMTHAYRHERAAVVSTAGYMGPVWGVALDWVLFGVVVGGDTLLGGAVIVGASLWLVFRARGATAA